MIIALAMGAGVLPAVGQRTMLTGPSVQPIHKLNVFKEVWAAPQELVQLG